MYKYIKASKDDELVYLDAISPDEFTWPNGSNYVQDHDLVSAIAYMYGESFNEAKQELESGVYTFKEVQRALNYYGTHASKDWDKDENF